MEIVVGTIPRLLAVDPGSRGCGCGTEDFADLGQEDFGLEGFFEEDAAVQECAFADEVGVGVSGDVEDF
jgi:hypothetical protein